MRFKFTFFQISFALFKNPKSVDFFPTTPPHKLRLFLLLLSWKILIVIHKALMLLFLPVSCHYTRPRSARTHLAALAGAKNVALDADLPCVFLGGGRVVQVQNCSVVVRTLVTNELDERTSVTGIVW